ncbi:MAG TPA: metalloregulator ArsR/SmtB family transcription factor [Nocardioides sp.]|jgi:DNA-binding transcriptional ArsR family regulator|nr:metalloregulator ArsR/SmtB family transcription factor [Nocardioides sp.]
MTDQTALARAFTALADPTRREIFERVASRAQAVGELAGDLPVSRPAVSQHLKVLSDAGLVTARADGTRRIYELDPQGLAGLRDYLDGFWQRSLHAFARAAEQHHQSRQENR